MVRHIGDEVQEKLKLIFAAEIKKSMDSNTGIFEIEAIPFTKYGVKAYTARTTLCVSFELSTKFDIRNDSVKDILAIGLGDGFAAMLVKVVNDPSKLEETWKR